MMGHGMKKGQRKRLLSSYVPPDTIIRSRKGRLTSSTDLLDHSLKNS